MAKLSALVLGSGGDTAKIEAIVKRQQRAMKLINARFKVLLHGGRKRREPMPLPEGILMPGLKHHPAIELAAAAVRVGQGGA